MGNFYRRLELQLTRNNEQGTRDDKIPSAMIVATKKRVFGDNYFSCRGTCFCWSDASLCLPFLWSFWMNNVFYTFKIEQDVLEYEFHSYSWFMGRESECTKGDSTRESKGKIVPICASWHVNFYSNHVAQKLTSNYYIVVAVHESLYNNTIQNFQKFPMWDFRAPQSSFLMRQGPCWIGSTTFFGWS